MTQKPAGQVLEGRNATDSCSCLPALHLRRLTTENTELGPPVLLSWPIVCVCVCQPLKASPLCVCLPQESMIPLGLFFTDCSRQLFPFPFSPRRPGTLTWPLSSGTFLSASVSQTWQAPPSLWTRLCTVPVGLSCQRVAFGRFARGRAGGVGSGWFRFSPPVPCSEVAVQHVVFLSVRELSAGEAAVNSKQLQSLQSCVCRKVFLSCRVVFVSFPNSLTLDLWLWLTRSSGWNPSWQNRKKNSITNSIFYQRSNSASSAVKLFKTVKKHLSLLTQLTDNTIYLKINTQAWTLWWFVE